MFVAKLSSAATWQARPCRKLSRGSVLLIATVADHAPGIFCIRGLTRCSITETSAAADCSLGSSCTDRFVGETAHPSIAHCHAEAQARSQHG